MRGVREMWENAGTLIVAIAIMIIINLLTNGTAVCVSSNKRRKEKKEKETKEHKTITKRKNKTQSPRYPHKSMNDRLPARKLKKDGNPK